MTLWIILSKDLLLCLLELLKRRLSSQIWAFLTPPGLLTLSTLPLLGYLLLLWSWFDALNIVLDGVLVEGWICTAGVSWATVFIVHFGEEIFVKGLVMYSVQIRMDWILCMCGIVWGWDTTGCLAGSFCQNTDRMSRINGRCRATDSWILLCQNFDRTNIWIFLLAIRALWLMVTGSETTITRTISLLNHFWIFLLDLFWLVLVLEVLHLWI
jgi:hypothetical protein